MRTALAILGLVALAQTAFADATPPPQAPPIRMKVVPPQAPPLVAAEVRVTVPYGLTDPSNTELTLQGAVAEAQRRWGTTGTAWADPRDLAGVIWLHVGTFDPATSKYWIYGRGLSWGQAFRDAVTNGWPEVKGRGTPMRELVPAPAPEPEVDVQFEPTAYYAPAPSFQSFVPMRFAGRGSC